MDLHDSAVKEETGFTAIEMLLCLIIVILITFVGYYIYNAQKNTDAINKAVSTAASSPVPKTTRKLATSTAGYLSIKEWGVKLPLSSDTNDAVYSKTSGESTAAGIPQPDGDYAYLSLQQFASNPSCSVDRGTLGAITRFTAKTPDPVNPGGTLLADSPNATKVGDYYYQFESSKSGCYSDAKTATQAAKSRDAFIQAIKSIVAD